MTCIRPYSYVVFAVTSPAPVASHAIEDPALVDTPENVLPPWTNRAAPCKVTVNGKTGYMMTRYLVRGGGNQDVSCAFETLMAVEALGDGAPIYRVPDDTVEAFGRFLGDYVIGVYGDDWVIAMTWDGDVGYVRRADLWAGNG